MRGSRRPGGLRGLGYGAAVCALALLAGCTGAAGTASHHRLSAVPGFGAQDIDAAPAGRLRDGGTLTLPLAAWSPQLNYGHVDGGTDDVWQIASLAEPMLFARDPRGVPRPDPDYLVSAEVTDTSPQTVTYRLNPKARWSDGTPLGVADFAAQWKALGRGDDRYRVGDPAGYDRIADVRRGAGAHEVKVVFRAPYADWQRLFTPLYPAAATATPDQFDKGWVDKVPVGAGPYRISSVNSTTQTVTAVRDPHWWGDRPRLDKIVLRALLPDAALQAYRNGELDAVNAANTEDYAQLKDAEGSEIRTGSAWDEVHVALNGAGGPLSSLDVRRAVQQAVNREALADVAEKGLPVGVPLLGNHIFMTNQPGYADHSVPYGSYDPDEARRLLDKAGWRARGDGEPRTRNGQELKLRFVISSATNRLGLDLSQLIQEMLRQVGIEVDIVKVPANDYGSQYLNQGNFDLAIFRFVGMTYPGSLVSVYQQPSGRNSFLNYGRIGDATVDRLLREAQGTLDQRRATALYNRADAEIWRIGHDIELYQRPQMMAVRKDLANYGIPGLGDLDWTKVGWKS
ncbi:ABC transporter family substrate-binding protein [Streptomyces kunmingensis]|uniref:ABC transporter family substrate-binding protein n=1 Tax=Streptomyces kunmingensis TaxID=68225 RepID=A0ABU6CLC1_9ACTN|nr:ABC transporter family substrate-binding protein [Streptomyces kunmingensis]MEB3964700.1 ABC transporter family substrate-binding protein [Streptomyces kunmingensis]